MKKRLLTLLLCLTTIVAMSACATTTTPAATTAPSAEATTAAADTAAATAAPAAPEKVQLKFLAPSEVFIQDYNTNAFTKWMEEKTGVHVIWSNIPSNSTTQGSEEKLTMILASNDLPDVFLGCSLSDAMISRYGVDEQLLMPIESLIDKDMVNFKKSIAKFGGVDILRSVDGHIYSLPTLDTCQHCEHAAKMWLYDPWMTKLGLKYPTTTDEFESVLKAFKDQDPNGNGKADEIPWCGAFTGWHNGVDEYLLNSFLYYSRPDMGFFLKDGTIGSSLDKDAYREGLKYLNKLYKEGLIYEGSLTQDYTEVVKLTENPDAALVGAVTGGWVGMFANFGGERGSAFRPIAPLKGPGGVQISPTFPSLPGKGSFCLSKNCSNPDAAIKYADVLYTQEASLDIRAGGMEGNFWRKATDGEMSFEGKQAVWMQLKPWNDKDPQNESWISVGVWDFTDLRAEQAVKPEAKQDMWGTAGLEYMLYSKTMELYKPYEVNEAIPPLNFTVDEQEQLGTLKTDFQKFMDSSQFDFISGNTSLDSDWDKYLSDLDKAGLTQIAKLYQTAYDRQYKK